MYLQNLEATQQLTRAEFKKYRDIHWGIECYHRALKQVWEFQTLWSEKVRRLLLTFSVPSERLHN
jgi:hypothetical protein